MAKNLITIAEVERRIARDGRGAYLNITRDLEAKKAGEIPTLAQEISEYCTAYRETRKVQSWTNVRRRLKRLQEQVVEGRTLELGRIPIDQVTAMDIDRALRAISDSPTTQENIRVATSGLFRWSVEQEKQNAKSQNRERRWVDNPASKVPARDKAIRVRVLTTDEVIRLLRCAEPYQEAYLRSFLHLGFRHGELTHTRLGDDLDVNAWIWEISNDHPPDERCSCAPCKDTGWSTKNKNAPRTIHVPAEPAAIRASIKRYLGLFPAQPGDYVFRNPRPRGPWVDRSLH